MPRRRPQPKGDSTGVARIKQPHGGALLASGVPGNRGGGRPPSAIRATARNAFDEALPVIAKLVMNNRTKTIDRIRGADVLGRYGMGHPVSIDDVLACWHEQTAVIRERFTPDISEPLIAALRPIWVGLGQVRKKS